MPKTIDNDIVGTTNCFGFDTAVAFATDAIDRLHTTAEAHRRIMVVEVMGRYAGWIALHAGVAGGADAILIPEIPFDLDAVAERLRERDRWGAQLQHRGRGRRRVPEGREAGAARGGARRATSSGSAASARRSARRSATLTGKETRSVVLGHLQRGGAPTSFDRVLATRFGGKAVELVKAGRVRDDGGVRPAGHRRPAARETSWARRRPCRSTPICCSTAKALGVTFGD